MNDLRRRSRRCPCGNEVQTKRGLPRCDDCRIEHKHYPMTENARYTKALVVRMPASLYEQVKAAAAEEGVTLADFVRRALWKYVT